MKTNWIISLTLLCFIKSFPKHRIKQTYSFQSNPGKVINFSTDQFLISLLGYFLAHFRFRNCFIKNTRFKTTPVSSEARQPKQSPVLGSHRPSIHKEPGPGNQGCLGRRSVTLNVQAMSLHFIWSSYPIVAQC